MREDTQSIMYLQQVQEYVIAILGLDAQGQGVPMSTSNLNA